VIAYTIVMTLISRTTDHKVAKFERIRQKQTYWTWSNLS